VPPRRSGEEQRGGEGYDSGGGGAKITIKEGEPKIGNIEGSRRET